MVYFRFLLKNWFSALFTCRRWCTALSGLGVWLCQRWETGAIRGNPFLKGTVYVIHSFLKGIVYVIHSFHKGIVDVINSFSKGIVYIIHSFLKMTFDVIH